MSEANIQRAILAALEAIGAFAWRANSGGDKPMKVRGGYMQLSPPGTPDILVAVPPLGRLLGLEVKTATGKERASQVAWAEAASRHGVTVQTVRTPAEAVRAYQDAKTRPRATSSKLEL
jgi:hypothetical protein